MGAAGFTPGGFPFVGGVDAREGIFPALGKLAQMPYVWLPRRDPPIHEPQNGDAGGTLGATAKWWQFLTP